MMHARAAGSRRQAGVCWNSQLPYDIVRRIADVFLATNDVDYYMDFRAVCRDWRSATDDPRSASWDDLRFRPRRWIILHVEDFDGDAGLLLNTATGRFLRRDALMAPVLRTHRFAPTATAAGSLLILVDKDDTDNTGGLRVLNPLTGHSVRFRAAMPTLASIYNVSVVAVLGGGPSPSPPTLVLYSGGNLFSAHPDSETFVAYTAASKGSLFRQAIANGVYSDVMIETRSFGRDHPVIKAAAGDDCTIAESAGETLAIVVRRRQQSQNPSTTPRPRVEVYSVTYTDADLVVLRPVKKSIGGRAIFVGAFKCLSVDAGKFPGINADCVYYMGGESECTIWVHDMRKETEETVIGVPLLNDRQPPFSIVQLLTNHASDIHILTLLLRDIDQDLADEQETHVVN